MAATTRKSYKNILLAPPPATAFIHVYPVDKYLGQDADVEYILGCIGNQVMPKDIDEKNADKKNIYKNFNREWEKWYLPDGNNQLGSYIVYRYEQNALIKYQDPSNPDYKRMLNDMNWLAKQLNAYVFVYLGHMETCETFVREQYEEYVRQNLKENRYGRPTIFLIIACYGYKIAERLNHEPEFKFFQDNNIAFFGFQDFMHFYEGKILSCKDLHYKSVDVRCDYDGSEEDANELLEGNKLPSNIADYDRNNPLIQCCEAKLERIYKTFIDELFNRKTTIYTKEKLYEKFLPFASSGDRSLLTEDYVTIKSEDGIPCTNYEDCGLTKPSSKGEALAKEFNERGKKRALFYKLSYLITNRESQEKKDSIENRVKEFWKEIQNLPEDLQDVFTIKYRTWNIPVLILLSNEEYFETKEITRFEMISYILDTYGKHLDLSVTKLDGFYRKRNILHDIIQSPRNVLVGKEKYILFRKIFKIIPDETTRDEVFLGNRSKNMQCPLQSVTNEYDFSYPILQFYIVNFGSKLNTVDYYQNGHYVKGNLLHLLMEFTPKNEENQQIYMQCIFALLSNGMNPNQKMIVDDNDFNQFKENRLMLQTNNYRRSSIERRIDDEYDYFKNNIQIKPLEVYTKLHFPNYDFDLILLFVRYGMTNDDGFFTRETARWKNLQNKSKVDIEILIYSALLEYINEQKNSVYNEYYDTYNLRQVGGGPRSYSNYSNYSNNYNNYRSEYQRMVNSLTYNEATKLHKLEDFYEKCYSKLWSELYSQIGNFLRDVNYRRADFNARVKRTIEVFEEALRLRKGVSKHGSKVRKSRKRNKNVINKTIKNRLVPINFNININEMLEKYIKKIKLNVEKPQLTENEKTHFKSRYNQIVAQKNVLPKDKIEVLKNIESKIDAVIAERGRYRSLTEEITDFIKKPQFTKAEKAKFRSSFVDITKRSNIPQQEKANLLQTLYDQIKTVFGTK